ncbi:hypothetical protein CN878_02805 [Ochrobactrum sp. 695/2009]|nr:hypothetical protein [Brucella intermedia]PJR89951.1 hypothetical protein CN881_12210 [Ochrobactrum sp. 721/2009]PJT14168.1 hypothetical protein CN880_21240 [Ochrobactrum sp. 720/2009]PJT24337.1 hypothetical protein CN879_08270 [Ochrobactrum sp. 715/2009]PJT30338.1 hypothetical protein CN878_02805 [Ochrobactrum sp. 695/2009]PJT33865.1 hypothetical protein CN877_09700 [Ochrobactrum sp. 689/2009]
MRVCFLVIAAAVVAMPVLANEQDAAFAQAALECWSPPASMKLASKIVLSVELDKEGDLADVTAKEFPKDGVGKAGVESLNRALQRCAPYKLPGGTYTLTIDPRAKGANSLNPFK